MSDTREALLCNAGRRRESTAAAVAAHDQSSHAGVLVSRQALPPYEQYPPMNDPGLFPAPEPPNPLALTVPCRYCREPRHHPCRHTMLPGRPVTATHQHRIDDAQEVPF